MVESGVYDVLIGQYEHNLDAKGRIIIPAKLREALGEQIIVTRGLDTNLYIYPHSTFETMTQKVLSLPMTHKDARAYRAVTIASAVECELDNQGRINLPANLIKSANLSKQAIIIGSIDHVEIWDLSTWNQYLQESTDAISQIAENLTEYLV